MPFEQEPPDANDLDESEYMYACPPPRGRARRAVRKRNLVQLSHDIHRFRLIFKMKFCPPSARRRPFDYMMDNPDVDHRAKQWVQQARLADPVRYSIAADASSISSG